MDERTELQVLRDHFLQAAKFDEHSAVFLPFIMSLDPTSERTRTVENQAAWHVYVETKGGVIHAQWLARREADPDAVVTPEDALAIIRPLVDRTRVAPVPLAQEIASHWLSLADTDADKRTLLRLYIAKALEQPDLHDALTEIAVRNASADVRVQPAGHQLPRELVDDLEVLDHASAGCRCAQHR